MGLTPLDPRPFDALRGEHCYGSVKGNFQHPKFGSLFMLPGLLEHGQAIAYRLSRVCQKKKRSEMSRPFASYQDFSDGLEGEKSLPFQKPSQGSEGKKKLTPREYR